MERERMSDHYFTAPILFKPGDSIEDAIRALAASVGLTVNLAEITAPATIEWFHPSGGLGLSAEEKTEIRRRWEAGEGSRRDHWSEECETCAEFRRLHLEWMNEEPS
jgi:hypothetical protein